MMKNKKILAITGIVITVLVGALIKYAIKDKISPEISNIPEKVEFYVTEKIDIKEWFKNSGIIITDNKNEFIYEIDDSEVKLDTVGQYNLKIYAEDKAGNVNEKDIGVIIKDNLVHLAYNEATNLDLLKLKKSQTGKYSYNDITLVIDDDKYIENDCLYRSVAKGLEGFYKYGKLMYGNWSNDFVTKVFGFDKKDSYEEMKVHVDDVSQFITKETYLSEIMTRFESLQCVEGNFNYESGSFLFGISDLNEAANEMRISETMLGYILAAIEVYDPETTFEGNTYYCELNLNLPEDRNKITKEAYSNTQGGMFSPVRSRNEYDELGNIGENIKFYGYLEDHDGYKQEIINTSRGIRIGSSYNSLIFAYGSGSEGVIDKNNDEFYQMFCTGLGNPVSVDSLAKECYKYVAYTCDETGGQVVFYVDENDYVTWIIYFSDFIYY